MVPLRNGHFSARLATLPAQVDPSLYNLAKYNLLSREFAMIGIARQPMTTDEFRAKLVADLKEFVDG